MDVRRLIAIPALAIVFLAAVACAHDDDAPQERPNGSSQTDDRTDRFDPSAQLTADGEELIDLYQPTAEAKVIDLLSHFTRQYGEYLLPDADGYSYKADIINPLLQLAATLSRHDILYLSRAVDQLALNLSHFSGTFTPDNSRRMWTSADGAEGGIADLNEGVALLFTYYGQQCSIAADGDSSFHITIGDDTALSCQYTINDDYGVIRTSTVTCGELTVYSHVILSQATTLSESAIDLIELFTFGGKEIFTAKATASGPTITDAALYNSDYGAYIATVKACSAYNTYNFSAPFNIYGSTADPTQLLNVSATMWDNESSASTAATAVNQSLSAKLRFIDDETPPKISLTDTDKTYPLRWECHLANESSNATVYYQDWDIHPVIVTEAGTAGRPLDDYFAGIKIGDIVSQYRNLLGILKSLSDNH